MVERYDIIRHAELVHGDIAVAAVEKEIDRVTAAKAADELLTLSGIHASFVLFKNGTGREPCPRARSVRSTYSSLWKNSAAAAIRPPRAAR